MVHKNHRIKERTTFFDVGFFMLGKRVSPDIHKEGKGKGENHTANGVNSHISRKFEIQAFSSVKRGWKTGNSHF